MHPTIISASMLAADPLNLQHELQRVIDSGVTSIHVDVMDYHYVPNLTFGPLFIKALRKQFRNIEIDVHLMVDNVDSMLDGFIATRPDFITFHGRTCHHIDRTVKYIKQHGIKAGLAINPGDALHDLEYLLPIVDSVLVMSVNPGFTGQSFIPHTKEKIAYLRQRMLSRSRISVDGGVDASNAAELVAQGANHLVMGAAIFHHRSIEENIAEIRKSLKMLSH